VRGLALALGESRSRPREEGKEGDVELARLVANPMEQLQAGKALTDEPSCEGVVTSQGEKDPLEKENLLGSELDVGGSN